MQFKRLNKILNGAAAYGLDINMYTSDEWHLYLIETLQEKSELQIVKTLKSHSIDQLKKKDIKSELPFYLNLRGKGVLQRKVTYTEKENHDVLINRAFPNLKFSDFFFQVDPISHNEAWVVMTRRELVSEALEKLKLLGIHIIHFSLGLFHIGKLTNILVEKTLILDDIELTIRNEKLISLETTNLPSKSVSIGGEILDGNFVSALSVNLNHYGLNNESLLINKLEERQNQFKHHRIFRIGVWTILSTFLLILLLNFFVFQTLNKEYIKLSDSKSVNEALLIKLDKLQTEYDNSTLFFENTRLSRMSNNAYYADRLAITRPQQVYWNSLEINPPFKKIKNGDNVKFEIGSIIIKGNVASSSVLNEWLELLEKEPWIKSINIRDLQQIGGLKKNAFVLQIQTV